MTDQEQKEYYDKKLAEMPEDFLKQAIEVLEVELNDDVKRSIRDAWTKDPNWFAGYHFGWGMAIRNLLRQKGLDDTRLLDNNWDDYYHQVVEIVVGIRNMPSKKPTLIEKVRRQIRIIGG